MKKFDSKKLSLNELEERKEMIVLWRRGDGVLPKDQTHIPEPGEEDLWHVDY